MNITNKILHSARMLGALTAVGLMAPWSPAAGVWETKAPLPEVRYGAQACVVDGKIFLFGGMKHEYMMNPAIGDLAETTLVYDPASDSWEQRAGMSTKRAYPLITEAVDGCVYVIGGRASIVGQQLGGFSDVVERFALSTSAWTARSSLPAPRGEATQCVAAVAVGTTIYVLRNGPNVPATVDAYDTRLDTWRPRASMPVTASVLKVCVMNGLIYVLAANGHLTAYDPTADTWSTKAALPNANSQWSAVTVVNGLVYVFSADFANSSTAILRYDPATDRWEQRTTLPYEIWPEAIATQNGLIYLFGDWTGNGKLTIYDPVQNSVSNRMPMPRCRNGFACAQVSGRFYLLGGGDYIEGFGIEGIGNLRAFNDVFTPDPGSQLPNLLGQPRSQTVTATEALTLSVAASAEDGPFTYQWQREGIDLPGATDPTLRLPCAQRCQSGLYSVVVRNQGGSTTSQAALVTVTPVTPASAARLLNLSTRASCLTGDNVLITGFVISGTGTKRLLLRTVGAALADYGVSGALADPTLVLNHRVGEGWEVAGTNDNWGTNANAADIAATAARVGAFDLGTASTDAALLVDLAPGIYTVVSAGQSGGTGVALVELYDADAAGGTARLINISTRGFVGTDASVMIPGFVVSSEGPKTFLLRAIGPALGAYGVTGFLADPKLTVYRQIAGGGEAILSVDNWGENGDGVQVSTVAEQVGAFALPSHSKDAAVVLTLPPGIYTAVASGSSSGTGVALVELYEVP